jgi:hypothetical protein
VLQEAFVPAETAEHEAKWRGTRQGINKSSCTVLTRRSFQTAFNSRQAEGFLPLPRRPQSVLQNGYYDLFPRGQSGHNTKLTAHLHVVSELIPSATVHLHEVVFN